MANTLEPVEYPKVVIDGLSYSLKFGPGAQLRLERFGMGPDKMKEFFIFEGQADGSEKATGTRMPLTVLFSTLAACAGTPLKGGRWKPIGMSPEEIADVIPQEDIPLMGEAIGRMWSKAKPEGANPATVPASSPEPLQ
jgi:hypothetical protein